MAPPQETSTSTTSGSAPSTTANGTQQQQQQQQQQPQSQPDPNLVMGYTPTQLKSALNSLNGPNPDQTCRHIYGYGDEQHELSMLQKVTAVRILDYEKMMAEPSTPSIPTLQTLATEFHTTHGPILNLRTVIQNQSPKMCLAAEFKRASPSKGDINPGLTCAEQAVKYAQAGATVISVLTEPRWFRGGLHDLRAARLATTTNQPNLITHRPAILRKEFVTTPYQIYEAAASGADTILLIVAVTPADLLATLISTCRSIGMEPLVEVHGELELDVALNAGAKVIGVNNRNLHNFRMDLGTTDKTAGELVKRGIRFDHNAKVVGKVSSGGSGQEKPDSDYVLCSLSGMSSAEDVHRYRQLGVGMCLIGESLMRAPDPQAAIGSLCLDPADYDKSHRVVVGAEEAGGADGAGGSGFLGVAGAYTAGTKLVKVCGVTNPDDALVACRAGANLIGVIFVPKSKRCVSPGQACEVVRAVREFGERSARVDLDLLASNVSTVGTVSPLQSLIVKARALEGASSRRPLVVGVFQNQDGAYVREMVNQCGLDMVQLHGREGMEAASVENCGVPALRVVDIETGGGDGGGEAAEASSSDGAVARILASLTSDPAAILLDTSIKGSKDGGGTGVTFDWSIAEQIQNSGLPVIIAGGLKPTNVGEAVSTVRPWGVDVSSGVEESPGRKDHDAVRSFVGGAREAALEASKGF